MIAKLVSVITILVMFFESMFGIGMATNSKTDFSECKNVIFMIGDGMGFNSINKTKAETGIATLNMDTFPLAGASKTASADGVVTDSAAGGTALAAAVRVANRSLGVYTYDKDAIYTNPMNLTELAISQGKLAGVITTDSTSGATPASFSSHTSDRGNEADITAQQLKSDLTLVWGTSTSSFTAESAEENGFISVYDKTGMDALTDGTRSFGQFTGELWHEASPENMPTLAEMTEKAIDLLDDDEDGFFLMVEGAHIDKNSHNNNADGMKDALLSFDNAVGEALEYAATTGDTLVVVTADHETGGILKIGDSYKYTLTSHSAADVPLLVYGCDNFINNGEAIKNKEVSRRVACVMGEKNFPIRTVTNNPKQ